MLLKPWRNLRMDLKAENESWESAFEEFVTKHVQEENVKFTLSNVQFFHECDSAAQRTRDHVSNQDVKIVEEEETGEGEAFEQNEGDETTECIIRNIQETQTSWAEQQYAQFAVDIAILCGVFRPSDYNWRLERNPLRKAIEEDQIKLKSWKKEMSLKILENEQQTERILPCNRIQKVLPMIQPINEQDLLSHSTWDEISTGESCLTAADPSELNEDQVSFLFH